MMTSEIHAPRVLLCWEFGQGTTHARILKAIGDRLAEDGCRTTYVFCTPSAGAAVGIAKDNVRKGPGWPLKSDPDYGAHSLTSATYGDIFAQMFLDVEGELDERLRIWRKIIDDERPDLIIADYAPGLALAAAGTVPLIALGNGYTLPPADLDHFPVLGGSRQPVKYPEDEAVARINQVLAVQRCKPIERLAQINRADHYCLLTYPIFDPYRAERKDAWLGSPMVPNVAKAGAPGTLLFAYFYENRQLDDRLIEGLAGGGLAGNAVFTSPVRRTAKRLARANIETPFDLLDLADELPKTRVIVHQGGLNTCCAGALCGVPQVIVYTDQEKKLYAQSIVGHDAGFMLEWSSFTAGGLAAAIREAAGHDPVVKAARKLADELAPFRKMQPVAAVAEAALKLLNSPA
jgi:rhamnosyltransferase subunit B